MAKIFVVMGKSATGKDTIYKALLENKKVKLQAIIPYTTRPIREGEQDGVEYHFVTKERMQELMDSNDVIEYRVYNTIYGEWFYFTADDGQFNLMEENNYLMISTPEACEKLLHFLKSNIVIPIYIEVEDEYRLLRAIQREKQQKNPKYAELCRRFLSDEEDFSENILEKLEIKKRYQNMDMHRCIQQIIDDIISFI